MLSEKRRNSRKSFDRRAWIELGDGTPVIGCVLGNLSETGAKFFISATRELPKEFVLRLTPNGSVARKCRIAWRKDREVGVAFTARLVSMSASDSPCA
jgi:hypothetical protein